MTRDKLEQLGLFSRIEARLLGTGGGRSVESKMGRRQLTRPGAAAAIAVRDQKNDDQLRQLFHKHSYMFDTVWYSRQNQYENSTDPQKAVTVVVEHLLGIDEEGAHTPSPLFDPYWYSIAQFREWRGSVAALTHFLGKGAETGVQPSPYFETGHYEERYSAPAKRRKKELSRNAVEDYVLFGESERLSPNRWFDETWYVERNSELQRDIASGVVSSGFRHFIETGAGQRLDPGPCFAERRYLGANRDVAAAVAEGKLISGFDHWLRWGQFEDRTLGSESINGHTLIGAY